MMIGNLYIKHYYAIKYFVVDLFIHIYNYTMCV